MPAGEAVSLVTNEIPFTDPVEFVLDDGGNGWLTATCRGGFGVLDLDAGALPSPSLTRDSIVRSKFPPSPFKTCAFRFSSLNPMSFNCTSFDSNSPPAPPTLAPKTLDCLFTLMGEGGPLKPLVPRGE